MNFSADNIILIGSILLFISLLASRTTKYGIPALLLFLFIGMIAGSDGIGGIHFNDVGFTKFIGGIALSIILFSGGLDTKYSDVKPVIKQGLLLSTFGVLITCIIMGIMVFLLTNFSILEALLLGAIVSSTDAAAVFSILRSKSLGLKGNLRPLLELESGSNDPMAYFLTIIFTFLLTNKDASYLSLISMFFLQMGLGTLIGYFMGLLMHKVINWIKFEYDGLYSVLLLTMVFFIYSFTETVGGNAFLAIYISAFVLGNKDFVHKKSLTKHFDGHAWLMQIIMFITLGLLVFPKQLIPYIGIGLLITAILIFVARPLSIFISLAMFKMGFRKKLFISWVGLRGAVPIIFATIPLTSGVEKANVIFNLVFFITIVSVLVQGTTLPLVAKWLNLSVPVYLKKMSALDLELESRTKSIYSTFAIQPNYKCVGKSIVNLGLPKSIIITAIKRNDKFLVSDGTTILKSNDVLHVLADNDDSMSVLSNCLV